MSKKDKKRNKETLPVNPTVAEVQDMMAPKTEAVNTSALALIRAESLQEHSDRAHAKANTHSKTARTIAELEAWRKEIDATIAFLRATKE